MITDTDFCFVISGRDRIGQGINKSITFIPSVKGDGGVRVIDDISDRLPI